VRFFRRGRQRVPLTAQHAGWERAVTRAGKPPHRIVARSSLHTSSLSPITPPTVEYPPHTSVARFSLHASPLTAPPLVEYPPHTTSPGRVLRNSFAPTRGALHTLISRHAPTSPRCAATRAHTSGRPVARSTAQLASSWAAVLVVGVAMVCVCVGVWVGSP
jgi:hypothetical protein